VRLSLSADDLFILPPKWFFVKPYFLEAFEPSELGCHKVSRNKPVFLDVYWFFSRASCCGFGSHSFASALGAQI
jgi:hypothetical protein